MPFFFFKRLSDRVASDEGTFGRKRFVEQDLALGAVHQIPDRIMQNPFVVGGHCQVALLFTFSGFADDGHFGGQCRNP